MSLAKTPQPQHQQQHADASLRLGGWLFRRRSWLPVPLALALLLIRFGEAPPSRALVVAGFLIVAAGEGLRLWAVHHIGAISRTRSDRLGPLISTGPFVVVRNPLYLGNIALWLGFAVSARLLWVAPLLVAFLGFGYHAIVRWEEQLLESRLGDNYRAYAARVPRWRPRLGSVAAAERPAAAAYSRRETLFSERGTLIAIGVGYLLLYLKFTVYR